MRAAQNKPSGQGRSLRRHALFYLGGALVAAASLFIVACGGGGGKVTAGNAVVHIKMDEYRLKPDISSVPAGKVTFVVVNKGKDDHEVVILKTDTPANKLVVQSSSHKVDEDAAGENLGEVEVEMGTTGAGTFDLEPGHYVLVCNIKGHYEQGMFASFEVTGSPKSTEKKEAPEGKPEAKASTGERTEITLVKAVRPTLTNTIDALNKGDIAAAKKAFHDYDAAWNGVEVYINKRSPELYATLETDLQAKIQAKLDDPTSKTAEIVPLVQQELAKWDEAITLVSTGAPLSPLFDDVATLRILRAQTTREAAAVIKTGDMATVQSLLTTFINKWSDVEDLIHERSPDAYADIEAVMAKVNTAIRKDKPDVAEVTPLLNTLVERFNYGISLVNASARGADTSKTAFGKDDAQSAATLAAINVDLKASLTAWQAGKYPDATARARHAIDQLFALVQPALKKVGGNDAAIQKALDAYAAVAGQAGDGNAAAAANKAAIEAVAVGQQWVAGQFWTDSKLREAISTALKSPPLASAP